MRDNKQIKSYDVQFHFVLWCFQKKKKKSREREEPIDWEFSLESLGVTALICARISDWSCIYCLLLTFCLKYEAQLCFLSCAICPSGSWGAFEQILKREAILTCQYFIIFNKES